jgi:hypothetical protein
MRDFINLIESAHAVTWVAPKRPQDRVVWIDVAQLDASWAKDDLYVGPGAAGSRRKYDRFGEWLTTENKPVEMPEVTIGYRGEIVFTNGRHRFSWMRDHGAQALPVSVPADAAEAVDNRFGTSTHQTILA